MGKTPGNEQESIDTRRATDIFCGYLEDNLWSDTNAYDATNVLMIPLEYAFYYNNPDLKNCFSNYFSRLQNIPMEELDSLGALTKLHHFHLAARYAVLSNDIDLADWLKSEFEVLWSEDDAWLWGRDPFVGIAERIKWKLNTDANEVAKSYYRVIFDEDYYALSLGMDLYGIFNKNGLIEKCIGCVEAKDLFIRVFEERVKWTNDRWLIDVGLWRDHPDFHFSNYYVEPIDNEGTLLPKDTPAGITIDSSHAHRYPSWIRSAELALPEGADKEYIYLLKSGLKEQFINYILSDNYLDGMPLLNNYMDGSNGYYRYNYATHKGVRSGYEPYGLSGTFAFGWWSLLGDSHISDVYARLYNSFPLSPAQKHVYDDPSTRERHPLVASRFDNYTLEAIALMSRKLFISSERPED